MERIVLEVDDRIAKAWRETSSEKRREIVSKINVQMGKELLPYSKDEFIKYLDELRDKMAELGLTQEILDDILKDDR